MPWTVSDRAIWAVLIFSAGFALSYIPATLGKIKDLAEVPNSSDDTPSKQLQKDAEKALSLSTLKTLSDGYSHDIRTAAIKIVTNRALNSRTKQLLLSDLASPDYERRGNAINALDLLISRPPSLDRDTANHFADHASMYAIVEAFINLLPLHASESNVSEAAEGVLPASPIFPSRRPAHERRLLRILGDLLHHSETLRDKRSQAIMCILEAGIVSRWLKDYPFPCALPGTQKWNFKKADVCDLFDSKAWGSDDELMAQLICIINRHPLGVKQLYEAGLRTDPRLQDSTRYAPRWVRVDLQDGDSDVRMVNGESTAGDMVSNGILHGLGDDMINTHATRRPSSSLSPEEETLRRRRREAIVMADAGVPLGRENILERQDSRTPLSTVFLPTISGEAVSESRLQGTTAVGGESVPRVVSTTSSEIRRRFEEDYLALATLTQATNRAMHEQRNGGSADTMLFQPSVFLSEDSERLRSAEVQGEAAFNGRLRALEHVSRESEHGEGVANEDTEQA